MIHTYIRINQNTGSSNYLQHQLSKVISHARTCHTHAPLHHTKIHSPHQKFWLSQHGLYSLQLYRLGLNICTSSIQYMYSWILNCMYNLNMINYYYNRVWFPGRDFKTYTWLVDNTSTLVTTAVSDSIRLEWRPVVNTNTITVTKRDLQQSHHPQSQHTTPHGPQYNIFL